MPDPQPEDRAAPSLAGRTALVTGASRGIGRATALKLAAAGAHVLVHYGRSAAEAEQVAAAIRGAGDRADLVGADLAAAEGPQKLVACVRELVDGRLDILVLNAGISHSAPIEDTTIAEFDRLFAVNVRAPFFILQQSLPLFPQGASVVFVSSVVSRAALGTLAAYAGTKGAIDTVVRHAAASLGGRGIRVNAVAPGIVDTDMSSFTKTENGRAAALALQALKRIAEPGDVADAVRFLASDEARWITGQTLTVDGGTRL